MVVLEVTLGSTLSNFKIVSNVQVLSKLGVVATTEPVLITLREVRFLFHCCFSLRRGHSKKARFAKLAVPLHLN